MQMIEFKGEEGVVRASFAWGDRHGIDFEANLFGLPLSANGTEATFNIKPWNMLLYSDEFWTDSNGLEMQRRVRNQRASFTLNTTDNTTANYYPVNSLLAVRDDAGNSFAVVNDRSLGASFSPQGSYFNDRTGIEFLLQRRLYFDDSRGVAEALNDTDSNGNGLGVTAHFRLLIGKNRTLTERRISWEKRVQLEQDTPVYGFVRWTWGKDVPSLKLSGNTSTVTGSDSFDGTPIRVSFDPLAKNKLVLRIANIEDAFNQGIAQGVKVSPERIVRSHFANANWEKPDIIGKESVHLTRMSLTANQSYKKMQAGRLKFRAEEHDEPYSFEGEFDCGDLEEDEICVKPQEIHTYLAVVSMRKTTGSHVTA